MLLLEIVELPVHDSDRMRGVCAICGTDWFRFTPTGDVIECGFCEAPHRP